MSLSYPRQKKPLALRLFSILGILCLLLPGATQCAEWSLKGSVDQSLGYDSNVRMRQENQAQGSFFYKIIPVLTMAHKTDVSSIRADALYGTQTYSDLQGFDQDIQNYSLNGNYFTERFTWGIDLNYSIKPTRNNAFQDSGNFDSNAESTSKSVAPTVTYRINETDSLTFAPSYSTTNFDKAQGSNFRDYTSTDFNLAWQHMWTERYASSASFFYSMFESQTGNNIFVQDFSYDSYGINLSNTYSWSERLKLSGTVGARQTASKGAALGGSINGDSIGFLASFNADYTGDNYTTYLSFNRSLQPSNQGRLQEQTALDWGFNYKLTQNVSASFNFDYLQSSQVNQANQSERENIVIQPGINWHISPEWTLSGNYRYRMQDRDKVDAADPTNTRFAESHLVMFTINYNWQGLSISR